jgi:hypothetical protein
MCIKITTRNTTVTKHRAIGTVALLHSLLFSCLCVPFIFKMLAQVIIELLHTDKTEDHSTSLEMSGKKKYWRVSAESRNSLTRRGVRY